MPMPDSAMPRLTTAMLADAGFVGVDWALGPDPSLYIDGPGPDRPCLYALAVGSTVQYIGADIEQSASISVGDRIDADRAGTVWLDDHLFDMLLTGTVDVFAATSSGLTLQGEPEALPERWTATYALPWATTGR